MSSAAARRAVEVRPVAERILAALEPASQRIAVAGSLRRGAGMVSDIEIVCVPRRGPDLLGEPRGDCLVSKAVASLRDAGQLRWREETHLPPRDWAGRRAWNLVVLPEAIALDLFVVRPPAQWGAILAIRTGPADYSRRLVTSCRRRGFRCEDGRLVDAAGRTVHTPEEQDFIETCGLPWAEPEGRA